MATLKDIKGLPKKAAKSDSKIPVVAVADSTVQAYNSAVDAYKKAEENLDAIKPIVKQLGLTALCETNCSKGNNFLEHVSSVILKDSTGASCRVTNQKHSPKMDAEAVQAFFKSQRVEDGRPADVNKYVRYDVKVELSPEAFLVNEKFDQKRFDTFQAAMQIVADELGIANPLTFSKVLVLADGFGTARFIDFDAETNVLMDKVIPAKIAIASL